MITMTMAYIKRKRDKHLPRNIFFKTDQELIETIEEKGKQQLKLAWLNLLKAGMAVPKD